LYLRLAISILLPTTYRRKDSGSGPRDTAQKPLYCLLHESFRIPLPELDGSEPNQWVSLEVLEVAIDEEDREAEVEFVAKLILDNGLEILHEVSDFEKVDGKWLYHSGEFKSENSSLKKIPMGSPCPCQSGKAFKNCHYNK
jgi:hypothetical protein